MVEFRIEEAAVALGASSSGTAVDEDDGFAVGIAAFFVVYGMTRSYLEVTGGVRFDGWVEFS